MPMPFHPAEEGRPRDLTYAEWVAPQEIWRHERLPLDPGPAGTTL